jgi:hypothetical protein
MLPKLEADPLIGEILLINNAPQWEPDYYKDGNWTKLKVMKPPCNIYVNPSWNCGVNNANNDAICLMSDDVEFKMNVFSFLSDKLSKNDGCVGYTPFKGEELIEDTRDQINNTNNHYGVLMFFNRENYIPIPRELKIFFGDNWIFHTHLLRDKQPRHIKGFNIHTKLTTTSGFYPVSPHTTEVDMKLKEYEMVYGETMFWSLLNRWNIDNRLG